MKKILINNNFKIKNFLLLSMMFVFPGFVFAATPTNFKEILKIFFDLINSLIPVVTGMALLVFFWGLANFIFSAGDEKNLEKGKNIMKWGIIGLFIMVSVWGLVNIFYSSFGFSQPLGIPLLPTS